MSILVEEEPTLSQFELLDKLSKDLSASARLLGQREARFLVEFYYAMQDFRIRAASRVREASKDAEPNQVLSFVLDSNKRLEGNIQKALGEFANQYHVGRWLRSICGIGPVISAGLLAHLDVRLCKTAGHFWNFAGLNPAVKWEKGKKRPWNAELKTLLWKAGESFVKVQNNKNDYYGKLFAQRKREEWESNLSGRLQAAAESATTDKEFRDETNAKAWYTGQIDHKWARSIIEEGGKFTATIPAVAKTESGYKMLPPAHIHSRATRWVRKIFLSHVHHVMYEDYFQAAPPVPYVFEKMPEQDHRHFIPAPNWPFESGEGAKSLRDLLVD